MSRKESILIVDDDEDILQTLNDTFEPSFKVFLAKDGKDAFDLFLKHSVRAVITDCLIPSMDGAALIKEIRRTSQVPIIALTGVDSIYLLQSLQSGATEILSKPFTRFEIEYKLQSILKK